MFLSIRNILILLIKDWRSEIRSLQIFPPTIVLALAAVVLFHFSNIDLTKTTIGWAGTLWIVSMLTIVIILDRSLLGDMKNGIFNVLLAGPMTANQFLLEKLIFTGSILLGLQGLIVVLLVQMMDVTISTHYLTFVPLLFLTDFAILTLGLLCSLIAHVSHHRGAFLAGLLWPISLPIVLLSMMVIDNPGGAENIWLILGGFDIVLLGLGPMLLKGIAGK
jgi:ABC-type transport system involved in cytochrome c biogenesis permease component